MTLERRVLGTAGDAELAVSWSHGTPDDPRYRLILEVPELPELPQKRRHWTHHKRAADNWRLLVRALVNVQRRPDKPLRRAMIVCTRRSAREPDYDNLAASFKPVVDALCLSTSKLTRSDVLVDDSPRVLEREYRWEPTSGTGSIRIDLWERL